MASVILLLSLLICFQLTSASVVLVKLASSSQKWQTCGVREDSWGGSSSLFSHRGLWAQPFTGCYNDTLPDVHNRAALTNNVALFQRGNCTFTTKVQQVGDLVTAVVIVSRPQDGLVTPIAVNESIYADYNLPVLMIQASDAQLDWTKTNAFNLTLQPQTANIWDPNMVLFILIALGVIVAGSWWASASLQARLASPSPSTALRLSAEADEPETLDFSWQAVVIFLIMACTVLLLLYFFYQYLVYVLIAIFTLGAAGAWTTIVMRWLPRSSNTCLQQTFKLPCQLTATGQEMVVWVISFGFAMLWFGLRHKPYAWVLQDILGVGFMVNALHLIRIPSLKIVTIILVVFPIYDVFFVFITPHLTKNHDSVMVKAATGGGATEQIPLALMIPHFQSDYCYQGNSLLGFGDVMIPGLCVAYALRFDCIRLLHAKTFQTPPTAIHMLRATRYFPMTLFGYVLGLCVTYAAMAAMQSAQPALLYLGPSLLLAFYSCAWYYGEVGACWQATMSSTTSSAVNSSTDDTVEAANENSDDETSDRAPLLGGSDA
eukprot:m.106317 g.106317  ORF g.106317 m.106317 type:complete len:545 (+) comp15299_c0_seq2:62-1696(+)